MSGEPAGPRYGWPTSDELVAEIVRAARPLIAVGLLPHANEPLGSAFSDVVRTTRPQTGPGIALVGPIEPPPAAHRFPLPTDVLHYVRQGYLAGLADQVEFAHTATPSSPAQHRASMLRDVLRNLRPDVLLLLHNDVGARAPYVYGNRVWPAVERHLSTVIAEHYDDYPPDDMSWTEQLDRHTYAFFPCSRLGVVGSHSAGLFIEAELGLPTITLELPMFRWSAAPDARTAVLDAVGAWIAAGGSCGGDADALAATVSRALGGRTVPMVPAAVSAAVVTAVVTAVAADPHLAAAAAVATTSEGDLA